jgi:Zn-dependent protease
MFHRSLPLIRIATIPVRVHWSWLLIFALLIILLEPIYADLRLGVNAWATALLMGLLIAGSVLLHELGHALVARRYRLTVRGILLFALGGTAEVDNAASDPTAEFAIAVAGPLVNLLLAGLCGLLWLRMEPVSTVAGQLVSTLVFHLGMANAIMTVFNLIPGYPLDGGRIVRAIGWFLTDNMIAATRFAARSGQICGVGFGLAGVALLLIGQPFAALGSGMVGFFLYRTARASAYLLVAQTILAGISVSTLMQSGFRALSPELTLEQFATGYLPGHVETSFPVVSPLPAGSPSTLPVLLGMMTLPNLRRFPRRDWAGTRIDQAMTPLRSVYALLPQATAADALRLMLECNADLLPVVEGPHLLGVLRRQDVLVYAQMQMP